jgi:hypothetical protein
MKEINGERAFARHQKIADRELERRALFLENVRDLVEMFESEDFKAILGFDPPPTWAGYLGQIEVFYSRAQVERWRKVWTFCKTNNIDLLDVVEAPESRIEDISRIKGLNREEYAELITKAKLLTSRDWKDTIAPFLGKVTTDECMHPHPKVYIECTTCGNRTKQEVDMEQLKNAGKDEAL